MHRFQIKSCYLAPMNGMNTHSFSVEMVSRASINRISLGENTEKEVLVEGELGELIKIELIEGILLQIIGENGAIRIDLTEKELTIGLSKKNTN